jgi:hypothetical protein
MRTDTRVRRSHNLPKANAKNGGEKIPFHRFLSRCFINASSFLAVFVHFLYRSTTFGRYSRIGNFYCVFGSRLANIPINCRIPSRLVL